MMVKGKLGGAEEESLADQEICKSNGLYIMCKIWRLAPSGTGSYSWQTGWLADKI